MDQKEYFNDFMQVLSGCLSDKKNSMALEDTSQLMRETRRRRTKIILVGNGGSSAIAEHMAIDLTKNARLRAIAISGSPQLTTFANDYGYDKVYSKAIESYADRGDVLIAISSSGTSKNILNAVRTAKKLGCRVVTFSGFKKDNPLRKQGDINIYLESKAYGYVEIIHNLLMHYVNDSIIGRAKYKFR